MNLIKLAWKNIIHNPLTLILNLILLALGIGLINFILIFNHQIKTKFDNNLADIDLVIGAKGSPLQLILCSMYHVDTPTGNISIKEAKPFLRPGHPLIKTSVPLSLGDSYKSYRIVGTDHSILSLYNAKISTGKLWEDVYDVTIGSQVAQALGIKLGDTFKSSHGFVDDADMVHEHGAFKVVGILAPTGSVIDQLILCSTSSVWAVHAHDEADENHDHTPSKATDLDRPTLLTQEDQEITSLLIQYKSKTNFQALSMPRNINENTDLQAAAPAFELNRLYDMMGVGTKALQLIAYLIAFVSAISIFVSLLNSLKQRKYELSILRVLGGAPSRLFILIILEALILALLGFLLGMLSSYIAMSFLGTSLSEKYNYPFAVWIKHGKEFWLLAGTLLLGLLAGFIPSMMAYKTDIHNSLSHN